MTRNEAWKQLMLGLIYPAVLGTVFYSFLTAALGPVQVRILGQPTVPIAPALKWILLLTTMVFYCCDYLYIMFTREFVFGFFACDLFLLAGLYLTFSTIDISSTSNLPRRSLIVIALCYTAFMILYLAWDSFECWRSKDSKERILYKKVIVWEMASIVMLLIWLALESLIPSFNSDGSVLAVVVIVVTIWFGKFAFEKRAFYRALGTVS